ncbi:MAG: hypothetical protein AAF349_17765 [Cyanobacteria bacterium P01_A01_bin.68]
MNRTTKAKCSLFVFAISTVAATFLISNTPADAKGKNCKARFLIDGKVVKGWTNLGTVGGTARKKRCRRRGERHALRYIKYNQIGLTPEQVCKKYGAKGGATIYIDTEVEDLSNSQDGSKKSWLGLKGCTSICTYKPQFKSIGGGGSPLPNDPPIK